VDIYSFLGTLVVFLTLLNVVIWFQARCSLLATSRVVIAKERASEPRGKSRMA
jgi:hypothetical protein